MRLHSIPITPADRSHPLEGVCLSGTVWIILYLGDRLGLRQQDTCQAGLSGFASAVLNGKTDRSAACPGALSTRDNFRDSAGLRGRDFQLGACVLPRVEAAAEFEKTLSSLERRPQRRAAVIGAGSACSANGATRIRSTAPLDSASGCEFVGQETEVRSSMPQSPTRSGVRVVIATEVTRFPAADRKILGDREPAGQSLSSAVEGMMDPAISFPAEPDGYGPVSNALAATVDSLAYAGALPPVAEPARSAVTSGRRMLDGPIIERAERNASGQGHQRS